VGEIGLILHMLNRRHKFTVQSSVVAQTVPSGNWVDPTTTVVHASNAPCDTEGRPHTARNIDEATINAAVIVASKLLISRAAGGEAILGDEVTLAKDSSSPSRRRKAGGHRKVCTRPGAQTSCEPRPNGNCSEAKLVDGNERLANGDANPPQDNAHPPSDTREPPDVYFAA
jgi:hypothetical protein